MKSDLEGLAAKESGMKAIEGELVEIKAKPEYKLGFRKWIGLFVCVGVVGALTYLLREKHIALGTGCSTIVILYGTYVTGNVKKAKALVAGLIKPKI